MEMERKSDDSDSDHDHEDEDSGSDHEDDRDDDEDDVPNSGSKQADKADKAKRGRGRKKGFRKKSEHDIKYPFPSEREFKLWKRKKLIPVLDHQEILAIAMREFEVDKTLLDDRKYPKSYEAPLLIVDPLLKESAKASQDKATKDSSDCDPLRKKCKPKKKGQKSGQFSNKIQKRTKEGK